MMIDEQIELLSKKINEAEAMQCGIGCHDKIYPAEELLIEMWKEQRDGQVSTELLPKCPQCEGGMVLHLEVDRNFVRDQNWKISADAYQKFYNLSADKKVVLLELGVGMRNQLIKRPFMDLTFNQPRITYITFNKGEIYIPAQIAPQSIAMYGNIAEFLHLLSEKLISRQALPKISENINQKF